jgi:hypothetical protein
LAASYNGYDACSDGIARYGKWEKQMTQLLIDIGASGDECDVCKLNSRILEICRLYGVPIVDDRRSIFCIESEQKAKSLMDELVEARALLKAISEHRGMTITELHRAYLQEG